MSSQRFTFASVPGSVDDLKRLPEADLQSPFKTAALALLAMMKYEENKEACFEMLDFLKGPDTVSTYEKQFYQDRLVGKQYKIRSYFEGATVQNGYVPTKPYAITVSDNPYSYTDENYATMYVTSAGADNPRGIKLRKKPSTGEWFYTELQCLSDIRIPANEDPWA
ncbi:MAG: hypothetical protein Q4B67_03675 [Eubacteriales bacterium]|nr:hypothetical protein [Eubacteriales bacterium]